jgi:hypothetical protein
MDRVYSDIFLTIFMLILIPLSYLNCAKSANVLTQHLAVDLVVLGMYNRS